ncbi:MAG TPA: hypothetical protein VI072_17960 [Polyangiaceae bacterium]
MTHLAGKLTAWALPALLLGAGLAGCSAEGPEPVADEAEDSIISRPRTCASSTQCRGTEYCTTEDGVCNPCPLNALCPAVCYGTCAPRKPAFCGGIAGIPCPEGQQCIDDPSDDCDPLKGGADCGGICVGKCDYNDPRKTYVGKSPKQCMVIKFVCALGTSYFSDRCGCGCIKN